MVTHYWHTKLKVQVKRNAQQTIMQWPIAIRKLSIVGCVSRYFSSVFAGLSGVTELFIMSMRTLEFHSYWSNCEKSRSFLPQTKTIYNKQFLDTYIIYWIYVGRQLLWVAALGVAVIYIYSVAAFALLPNKFHNPNEDAENVLFCRTLIQCFVSVLEYGLLDTIGLVSLSPLLCTYVFKITIHVCMYICIGYSFTN